MKKSFGSKELKSTLNRYKFRKVFTLMRPEDLYYSNDFGPKTY